MYVKNADLYRLVLIDHALQEAGSGSQGEAGRVQEAGEEWQAHRERPPPCLVAIILKQLCDYRQGQGFFSHSESSDVAHAFWRETLSRPQH